MSFQGFLYARPLSAADNAVWTAVNSENMILNHQVLIDTTFHQRYLNILTNLSYVAAFLLISSNFKT